MEITTSPYLQQLCQLLLGCSSSLLTFFFLKRVFACRMVICRTSRTGIEKCAAKLFQTHGGSDNESSKLFPCQGIHFLMPSTPWAPLLFCPCPPTAPWSGHQDQKERGVLQLPGILFSVLSTDWSTPGSWISPSFPGEAEIDLLWQR